MNWVSAIVALLLGTAFLAVATVDAANTGVVDTMSLNVGNEAGSTVNRPSRRGEKKWSNEQCSVSHQGRYRDGRYRKAGIRYYEFDVRVTSNCRATLMTCFVQSRTLIYEQYNAGGRTTTARAPWWESSLQTLTLKPGETTETSPLGPTRRNSGEYEIECAHVSRS